jgi:hypothetical protein
MFVNSIVPKKEFVGIIVGKPLQDFTRPLGMPRGLKGLLHMLNAPFLQQQQTYVSCFDVVFYIVLLRD